MDGLCRYLMGRQLRYAADDGLPKYEPGEGGAPVHGLVIGKNILAARAFVFSLIVHIQGVSRRATDSRELDPTGYHLAEIHPVGAVFLFFEGNGGQRFHHPVGRSHIGRERPVRGLPLHRCLPGSIVKAGLVPAVLLFPGIVHLSRPQVSIHVGRKGRFPGRIRADAFLVTIFVVQFKARYKTRHPVGLALVFGRHRPGMEVSVTQGYSYGIVAFPQHFAHIVRQVQRPVGLYPRIQRNTLAFSKIGP